MKLIKNKVSALSSKEKEEEGEGYKPLFYFFSFSNDVMINPPSYDCILL